MGGRPVTEANGSFLYLLSLYETFDSSQGYVFHLGWLYLLSQLGSTSSGCFCVMLQGVTDTSGACSFQDMLLVSVFLIMLLRMMGSLQKFSSFLGLLVFQYFSTSLLAQSLVSMDYMCDGSSLSLFLILAMNPVLKESIFHLSMYFMIFVHSWRFSMENRIAFWISEWWCWGWVASRWKSCWMAFLVSCSLLLRMSVTSLFSSLICQFNSNYINITSPMAILNAFAYPLFKKTLGSKPINSFINIIILNNTHSICIPYHHPSASITSQSSRSIVNQCSYNTFDLNPDDQSLF